MSSTTTPSEIAYIYEMTWYESKRHKNPHTWMYFKEEKHTRWGHNWEEGRNNSQRCEIRVIAVPQSDDRYTMAVRSSNIEDNKTLPDYEKLFDVEDRDAMKKIIDEMDRNAHDIGGKRVWQTHENENNWTLADLFIRQLLNNMCDGFGLINVGYMFELLCKNKELLLKYDMISKQGWNNSGYPLWDNYEFDHNNMRELVR